MHALLPTGTFRVDCITINLVAYWWVCQNETWKHESQGGYLWAPKANATGFTFHHWASMLQVQPGDVIFSYVAQRIIAVSVAKSKAEEADQPDFDRRLWQTSGWRINVAYSLLSKPLPVKPIAASLIKLLPGKYSPLAKDGTGNQGYLFWLTPEAGRFLLDQIGSEIPGDDVAAIERGLTASIPDKTEREAVVRSRVGQGTFREELEKLWGGRCCVTGVSHPRLLRASHIKPWRDSNNAERLDPYNGLLLQPSYDAAFDAGLITFEASGIIVISPQFADADLHSLGISKAARIDPKPLNLPYLEYHRLHVFQVE